MNRKAQLTFMTLLAQCQVDPAMDLHQSTLNTLNVAPQYASPEGQPTQAPQPELESKQSSTVAKPLEAIAARIRSCIEDRASQESRDISCKVEAGPSGDFSCIYNNQGEPDTGDVESPNPQEALAGVSIRFSDEDGLYTVKSYTDTSPWLFYDIAMLDINPKMRRFAEWELSTADQAILCSTLYHSVLTAPTQAEVYPQMTEEEFLKEVIMPIKPNHTFTPEDYADIEKLRASWNSASSLDSRP